MRESVYDAQTCTRQIILLEYKRHQYKSEHKSLGFIILSKVWGAYLKP